MTGLGRSWVTVAAVLLMVLTACTNGAGPPTVTSTPRDELGFDEAALEAAFETLKSGVDSWNSNQLEWIAALQDPNVGYDEFLEVQQDVLERQAGVAARIGFEVASLPEALRPAFAPIADHYRERLALLQPLFGAAAGADQGLFDDALSDYQAHTQTAIEAIEGVLSDPAVREGLSASGATDAQIDAVLETFRSVFGTGD